MPARILIIEDQVGRSTQLSAYLEDHHYLVSITEYKEEGFEQLSHLWSDVVIIDLPLAGGQSLELYKKLKQTWALVPYQAPLVIFYNRERSLSFLMKAYRAGVDFIVEQEAAKSGSALQELRIVIEAMLLRATRIRFTSTPDQPVDQLPWFYEAL